MVPRANIENDEYKIQVEDVAIHLGYSFVF